MIDFGGRRLVTVRLAWSNDYVFSKRFLIRGRDWWVANILLYVLTALAVLDYGFNPDISNALLGIVAVGLGAVITLYVPSAHATTHELVLRGRFQRDRIAWSDVTKIVARVDHGTVVPVIRCKGGDVFLNAARRPVDHREHTDAVVTRLQEYLHAHPLDENPLLSTRRDESTTRTPEE